MNPVLRKELRSMLREKRAWLVPVVYAAVLASASYLFVLSTDNAGTASDIGQWFAGLVAAMQTIAVCIFAPLVGAGSIAGERERGTLTTLLAAPLPRFRILTGKVVAVVLYVLLMLSVSLPIAALSVLFGGADVPTLLGIYLTHAVLGLSLGCLGIAASTLFARTWTASLVAIGVALGLGLFTLAIFVALDGFTWWRSDSNTFLLRAIVSFNPGYGTVLFFAGDLPEFGLRAFWEHYAALTLLGGLAFAFAARRLARE